MFKNVANQGIIVYATLAGVPQTGDAGNITAYLDKDGGGAVQTNDVNPTELDATNLKGLYAFDMTQAETNADVLTLSPVSATGSVILEPVIIYVAPRSVTGYQGGAVWVDSTASNTNTVNHVDGTPDNPVSTIVAAKTIADSLGLKTFHLLPGSSITLAQAYDDYIFDACHATIALGGQSINNSVFIGAIITGNDDGSNVRHTQFFECFFGSSTLGQFVFTRSYIAGTITLAEAGDYYMHQCFSGIAGLGTPGLDFGAGVGVSNVNIRDYSGGFEIKNMGNIGADKLTVEGMGQLILNANCNPANSPEIAVRGLISPLTDNVAGGFVDGGGTLSQNARYDTGQINAEMVDVMSTDTQSLPGQGAPTTTPTITAMITYLYKQFRNKETQTNSTYKLFADDETTVDQQATISDDETTFTKGEIGTGA